MTAASLLSDLAGRGVVLTAEGGRLVIDAPEGVVTPDDVTALGSLKPSVLAILTAPPWPPRPPELSTWPIPVRQAWADRTAELEAAGLDWREAERTAFAEVRAAVEGGAKFGPEVAPDVLPAVAPLPAKARQTRLSAAS